MENDQDLIIDDKNFSEYFREVSYNAPAHGDKLVAFRALAYLCEGQLKQEIVNLLRLEFGSVQKAVSRLIKFAGASKPQAIRLCKEIVQDLLTGFSVKDVLGKEYPYHFEKLYYANPKYVPVDDKRWQILTNNSNK